MNSTPKNFMAVVAAAGLTIASSAVLAQSVTGGSAVTANSTDANSASALESTADRSSGAVSGTSSSAYESDNATASTSTEGTADYAVDDYADYADIAEDEVAAAGDKADDADLEGKAAEAEGKLAGAGEADADMPDADTPDVDQPDTDAAGDADNSDWIARENEATRSLNQQTLDEMRAESRQASETRGSSAAGDIYSQGEATSQADLEDAE